MKREQTTNWKVSWECTHTSLTVQDKKHKQYSKYDNSKCVSSAGREITNIHSLFILDHTVGCYKQYQPGTAMYLLSVVAMVYVITIDRAVGAPPEHRKDEVERLNATDNIF